MRTQPPSSNRNLRRSGASRARYWLVAATGVSALALLCCSSPEEKGTLARERAVVALEEGRRTEALAALRELRDLDLEAPEAVLDLAALMTRAGDAPGAAWVLEAALAREPTHEPLRLALARTSLLVGDAARARAEMSRVVEGSELHADSLLIAARAELLLGDLEQCLALLEQMESTYPDRLESHLLRISALVRGDRLDEAHEALGAARRAVSQAPPSPERDAALLVAEVTLIQTTIRRGEVDEGLAQFARLVDANSDDDWLWQGLVHAHLRVGRPRPALEKLEQALSGAPERVSLQMLAASLLVSLGEFEAASARYRELLEAADSPGVRLALARLQLLQGDDDGGLATLEAALSRHPDAASLQATHAELLVARGDLAGARAAVARYEPASRGQPIWKFLRARIEISEGRTEVALDRLLGISAELDTAATQYWIGMALVNLGDRDGADRRFRAAMKRDPSMADAYLAALHLAEGRADATAVAELGGRMVRVLPGRLEGWLALGNARLSLGDAVAAERVARRAIERFPDAATLHGLQARALSGQARHADAVATVLAAEESLGRSAELDAEIALALFSAGRAEEALARVEAALDDEPENPLLHRTRMAVLFGTSQGDAGSLAADRALELDPSDPWPLRERARFFASTGRFEDAERDARRYLAARPDDAEIFFVLGAVLQGQGQVDAAIEAYRRSAQHDPRGFAARNNLAELLLERGDLEGALSASQEAYRLAPDDPRVLDTLAAVYLRMGLVERAVSFSEQAHRSAPGSPEIQLDLARAYGQAGRADDASLLLSDLEAQEDVPDAVRSGIHEVRAALP